MSGPDDQPGFIDNDRSLELIARTAVAQVEAGADIVRLQIGLTGASGRSERDSTRWVCSTRPSCRLAAKYASAFYGPFREAAAAAPQFGDRRGYQMDPGNVPLAASHVSGECPILKAAALRGWLDEKRAALEALTSIARAGADLTITYYAKDAARWLHQT